MCSNAVSPFDHDFGSFDDSGDGVALLELEFVRAAACDGTLDEIVSNPNCDVGHDIAQLDFLDLPAKLVSG
jgi:hypothetical protein